MRIEILGSGGATITPRPGSTLPVSLEAKEKGLPYSRSGPSLFVHGPDVLIDTPEESRLQLNRSQVTHIAAAFYSHWHPDHVMGCRVWETRNLDPFNPPGTVETTPIYFPQQVGADLRNRLPLWSSFTFMAERGYVRLVELEDGQSVSLGETSIRPFRLAEDYVYAFLFEDGHKRLLVAPDELNNWQPPDFVQRVDLAVIPMGLAELHPLNGERIIPEGHPLLQAEATFAETLEIVRNLQAQQVIMTHIEEPIGLGYDELLRLQEKLRGQGFPITFAFDTMLVDV